jgi:hypothetical protein
VTRWVSPVRQVAIVGDDDAGQITPDAVGVGLQQMLG